MAPITSLLPFSGLKAWLIYEQYRVRLGDDPDSRANLRGSEKVAMYCNRRAIIFLSHRVRLKPMRIEANTAPVAALFAEPSRAAILSVLLDGRALPAGELANLAGVSPTAASAHLTKLIDGGCWRWKSRPGIDITDWPMPALLT